MEMIGWLGESAADWLVAALLGGILVLSVRGWIVPSRRELDRLQARLKAADAIAREAKDEARAAKTQLDVRVDALQTQVLVAAGKVPSTALPPVTEAPEHTLGNEEAWAIAEASDIALVLERSYRRGLPQAAAELVRIYREEFPGETEREHFDAWIEDLRHRIEPNLTGFGQVFYTLDGPAGPRLGNLLRSPPESADEEDS